MEKIKNELIGFIGNLVKDGISIDEIYDHLEKKFGSGYKYKTITNLQAVSDKYKDHFVLISVSDINTMMYVEDVEYSGGLVREYVFCGPSVVFSNGEGTCNISFDSEGHYYLSSDVLVTDVRVLSIEETTDLMNKYSVENIEIVKKLFLNYINNHGM